jgi:hypothetical protein
MSEQAADDAKRLLDAAPDMLAALKQALPGLRLRLRREPEHKGLREDIVAIEAAIAKAEGRS